MIDMSSLYYIINMPHTTKMSNKVSLLLVLVTMLTLGSARVYSNKMSIISFKRSKAWQFMERMNIQEGNLTIAFKVALHAKEISNTAEYNLQLAAIPDQLWQQEVNDKCSVVSQSTSQSTINHTKIMTFNLTLNAMNTFKSQIFKQITIIGTQTYNFLLRDCSQSVANQTFGRDTKLQMELDIRNNGQHHSHTQSYYSWLLPLILLCACLTQWRLYRDKEEEGDNWLKWLLKGSIWFAIVAIIFKWWGFSIYAYMSGSEYAVFDYFYLIFSGIADSIIMVLLLLLSFGWTVTFNNHKQFDLYVPLASMLGVVNVLLTMLNKVTDGEVEKYHMFDTIPAYIMVGFRFLGFFIFVGGIIKSHLQTPKTQTKIKSYLSHLGVLGVIYLTYIPFFMLLITNFPSGHRKQLMFFGVEFVRYVFTLWLAFLGISKQSAYRQLINTSFMQKGDKYY